MCQHAYSGEEREQAPVGINVETFKGTVQLSGFVSSVAAEKTAMTVARNIEGVRSVKNDMRLK